MTLMSTGLATYENQEQRLGQMWEAGNCTVGDSITYLVLTWLMSQILQEEENMQKKMKSTCN